MAAWNSHAVMRQAESRVRGSQISHDTIDERMDRRDVHRHIRHIGDRNGRCSQQRHQAMASAYWHGILQGRSQVN